MEKMRKTYERRRNLFVGALGAIPGVRAAMPEGAFYAWVFFDAGGMNSMEMCEYLMDNARVVGMPGSAYGENETCCMRFSFANATEELQTAAKRIRVATEELAAEGGKRA